MDTFADLFRHFWWLLFPIIGMISMIVRSVAGANYDRERLRILKMYADKGLSIPETLRRDL